MARTESALGFEGGGMVFFQTKLKRKLRLEPSLLNKAIEQNVKEQLYQEIEGASGLDDVGMIVQVLEVVKISEGVIDPMDGVVEFEVEFTAAVFRAYANETVLAVVTSATQHGVWADVGPLQVFVHRSRLGQRGDYEYKMAENLWLNPQTQTTIEEDTVIRVKLLKVALDKPPATAAMDEPSLGPVAMKAGEAGAEAGAGIAGFASPAADGGEAAAAAL